MTDSRLNENVCESSAPIPGIRGVSAADGSDVWYQKGSGSHPPISWGRGLLAGDLILWPTSRRIYALRQIDGEQETTPTLLTGIPTGNLAFAGGAFLVTDRHFLHVLLPPKDEPKKDPKPMPRSTQGARVKIKRVIAHAPKLSLPLKQKWKQELGEGHFLLPADEQKASLIFSCSREGMLSCHDVATFERRWQRLLPFAVSWVALTEKLVFVAGQKGVVSLDREKGAERWRFFAPLQYRSRNAPALSDFRLSRDGLMLYFLQRGRRLFALESSTGKSLWMRQCSGAFLESPHRPFLIEKFELFSDAILVSMLERRRWLLDPKTGESLQEWTDAPGEIRLIREKSGFKIPNQTTLSGQAPRLVDGRFLIVGRNIGWTIHLLKGGKEIWDRPLFLRNDPKESLSWDDESVYLVESGQLRSFSLRDGRRRWSVSLPTIRSSWTTIRNGELILTVPGSRPRSRFSFRLALGAVEWNWRTSSEVKPGLGMPLLIHESRTGKLLQKWNLETSVPVGGSDNLTPQLVFTDQGLVIVDRNRIYRFELSRDQ